MLKPNIASLLLTRGVEDASRYLVKKGMKYYTVNRILAGNLDSITYAAIEQLCLHCNCTPDDLFVWEPDDNINIATDHPLYKLKPKPVVPSPVDRIKKLPVSKLEKLQDFMDKLEQE